MVIEGRGSCYCQGSGLGQMGFWQQGNHSAHKVCVSQGLGEEFIFYREYATKNWVWEHGVKGCVLIGQ